MKLKATTDNIKLLPEHVKWLRENLTIEERKRVLADMFLIVEGNSVEYAPVRGDKWHAWADERGLEAPIRIKYMCIRHEHGGIRVIVALTKRDENTDLLPTMFVGAVGFRDEDVYRDGK